MSLLILLSDVSQSGFARSQLAAEWAAANAAERSATWAMWSLIIGAAGILGLLATLRLTRRSTEAAFDTLHAQVAAQRPLVTLGGIECSSDDPETSIRDRKLNVRFWLTNHGASPAWTLDAHAEFSGIEPSNRVLPFPGRRGNLQGFVPKGLGLGGSLEPVEFTEAEFTPLVKNRNLYMNGWVEYRDPGGRVWVTSFAGWIELDNQFKGKGLNFWPSPTLWFDQRLN